MFDLYSLPDESLYFGDVFSHSSRFNYSCCSIKHAVHELLPNIACSLCYVCGDHSMLINLLYKFISQKSHLSWWFAWKWELQQKFCSCQHRIWIQQFETIVDHFAQCMLAKSNCFAYCSDFDHISVQDCVVSLYYQEISRTCFL